MADISIPGVAEWARKMRALDATLQGKVITGAMRASVAQLTLRIQRQAPRGSRVHKTYKGNSVAPGHLKQSIRAIASTKGGVPMLWLGVRKTAFYGPAFLDEGLTVTKRRLSTGGGAVRRGFLRSLRSGETRQVQAHALRRRGRTTVQIKPYRLRAWYFYERVVRAFLSRVVHGFADELGKRAERALRRGG